jgi:hypothetical protein
MQQTKEYSVMNHDAAKIGLQKIVEGLNVNFAGKYFMADGTLLGLVRDGGFITGDIDIDIAMWIEDFNDCIVDDMRAVGFYQINVDTHPGYRHNTHFFNGEITVDIYCFNRSETEFVAKFRSGKRQLCSVFPPFELETATFLGIEVLIPSPPERYLQTAYGKDWRYPVTKWDYRYGSKNLHPRGSLYWRLRFKFRRYLWRLYNGDIHIRSG